VQTNETFLLVGGIVASVFAQFQMTRNANAARAPFAQVSACLPACLLACLPACLPVCRPACLSACLPAYQATYAPSFVYPIP
jgi:hypothetical protein